MTEMENVQSQNLITKINSKRIYLLWYTLSGITYNTWLSAESDKQWRRKHIWWILNIACWPMHLFCLFSSSL